ncbi:MAG TPA: GTPase Era [Acidimicrobiia bacterium]|nr:GTPase Era [Acidimicrobiia bacterium]
MRSRRRWRPRRPTGAADVRSGFVTLVGRPNVGKSTLVNQIVGTKVSIVSARPQTTRTAVRGVRTTPDSQIVLLDTPGVHRPRTLLGERTNQRAVGTLAEVDAVCHVIAANEAIGRGDEFVARAVHEVGTPAILVVNKTDVADRAAIADHLASASTKLGEYAAYVPVSARTGDGVDALVGELEARLPEGPLYYPEGTVSDQPESALAAELVREKLLVIARDELPHSINATGELIEPEPGENPDVLRIRVVIRVERDSQKGIVIGRRGVVLRDAGTAARRELEALLGTRVYIETKVRVDPHWQRRAASLDRLGL